MMRSRCALRELAAGAVADAAAAGRAVVVATAWVAGADAGVAVTELGWLVTTGPEGVATAEAGVELLLGFVDPD